MFSVRQISMGALAIIAGVTIADRLGAGDATSLEMPPPASVLPPPDEWQACANGSTRFVAGLDDHTLELELKNTDGKTVFQARRVNMPKEKVASDGLLKILKQHCDGTFSPYTPLEFVMGIDAKNDIDGSFACLNSGLSATRIEVTLKKTGLVLLTEGSKQHPFDGSYADGIAVAKALCAQADNNPEVHLLPGPEQVRPRPAGPIISGSSQPAAH